MTPYLRAPKARPWRPDIDLAASTARAHDSDELVTLFSEDVWRFAAAQMRRREDAEDVVMETFAAAFRDFGRVKRADDQRHWLLAVARRKAADAYRKQYRRAEEPLSDESLLGSEAPSALQLAAREALAALPEGQREALTLKYVNGLSTAEVGRVTRRSTAATNSLLQRARQSLRDALALGNER